MNYLRESDSVIEIANNYANLPDMYGKVYIGRGCGSIVVRYAIDKELSYISKYEYLKLFYSKQVREYAGDYYQKSVKIPIHLCGKQIFVIASICEQLDFDECKFTIGRRTMDHEEIDLDYTRNIVKVRGCLMMQELYNELDDIPEIG